VVQFCTATHNANNNMLASEYLGAKPDEPVRRSRNVMRLDKLKHMLGPRPCNASPLDRNER
jgi:hypothetical protein